MRRRVRTVIGVCYGLNLLGGLILLRYPFFGEASPLVFLGCVIVGVVLTFFLGPGRSSPESQDSPSP
jgi:hypothetical protein